MNGFVVGIITTLAAIGSSAFLVSYFGLYPIGADNPPGRLEKTLAGRALNAYADKHKPAGDNPVQPTVDTLTVGATEYEEHCALCHGGAQARLSELRDKLSPPAPQLIDKIPHDPDAWLFWVTKHGVRMTGMPAWDGLLSDDQIWKIVAFIKHSDKLPLEVRSAWQTIGATTGEIQGQHQHRTTDVPATR
jgi:mono/diheme cytochrome c family protein